MTQHEVYCDRCDTCVCCTDDKAEAEREAHDHDRYHGALTTVCVIRTSEAEEDQ